MITVSERSRMLAVPLCGPRVVQRLESIGVTKLYDLRGRDAQDLMHEINIEAGRRDLAVADGNNRVGELDRCGTTPAVTWGCHARPDEM
jgi:hypothetical protein